jgi:hypothetical protein
MPRYERAALEAREQVARYVPTQFAGCWIETYHSDLLSRVPFGDTECEQRLAEDIRAIK